jgi:hypothetical protein
MKKVLLVAGIIVLMSGSGLAGYFIGQNGCSLLEEDTETGDLSIDSDETSTAGDNNQGDAGFSESGEKIDTPTYDQYFSSIKIGSIAKENSSVPDQPFVEDYTIASEQQDIQFQITTTNEFPEFGDVLVKAYDKDTGSFYSETITLNLRRGQNTMCCYPVPDAGEYEVLFYYENSLANVIDLSVN